MPPLGLWFGFASLFLSVLVLWGNQTSFETLFDGTESVTLNLLTCMNAIILYLQTASRRPEHIALHQNAKIQSGN
jgi:hypothetical protein